MIWTEDEAAFASIEDAPRTSISLVGLICAGFTALLILVGVVGLVQSFITM